MKTCAHCHRQYQDETLKFCLDDGALLVPELASTGLNSAGNQTLKLPISRTAQPPGRSTQPPSDPQPTINSVGFQAGGAASSSQNYQRDSRRSPAVLWVFGAIIIAGAAIAVALIVTRNRGENSQASNQTIAAASPAATAASASSTPGLASSTPAVTVSASKSPSINQAVNQKEAPTPSTNKPADRPSPIPTPPPQTTPRAPISGGVLNAKATYLAKPPYPALARAGRASGSVSVQVLVDEKGNVIAARAVSGHPLLHPSAIAAARSSKFKPTLLRGQPVKVSGVIIYNFVAQ
jgi:TonB family protein